MSQSPDPDWLTVLRSIVASVEATDVRDLELEAGGLRIALRRVEPTAYRPWPAVPADDASEAGLHAIRCPLTGIWYDAPKPGEPPFVEPGHRVEVGTVVGLVETMKVFNEVASDAAGIVRDILVRRGDLVMAHSPVMRLDIQEPLAGALA